MISTNSNSTIKNTWIRFVIFNKFSFYRCCRSLFFQILLVQLQLNRLVLCLTEMSTIFSLRLFRIHSSPVAYWLPPSVMLKNILISNWNNLLMLLWLWYANLSTNIPTQTRLQNEDNYSSSFGGYSRDPNMAVPFLTFVLPISIFKIRVSWLKNIMTNHNTYSFSVRQLFSMGKNYSLQLAQSLQSCP